MNDLYINIGSEKSCLFVKMSLFLIKVLEKRPLLYYATEEALECAKSDCFGIGIIVFSQLLNIFNKPAPESRNIVAHEILEQRPTKETFDSIVESFKEAASERSKQEIADFEDVEKYQQKIAEDWKLLVKSLHNIDI